MREDRFTVREARAIGLMGIMVGAIGALFLRIVIMALFH